MSLDITLYANVPATDVVCRRCGSDECDKQNVEVFEWNITHNLTVMADAAGAYKAVWRPEENGFASAGQVAPILREAIKQMERDPAKFQKHNPENGWGTYDGLLKFFRNYLEACERYPEATIHACR